MHKYVQGPLNQKNILKDLKSTFNSLIILTRRSFKGSANSWHRRNSLWDWGH